MTAHNPSQRLSLTDALDHNFFLLPIDSLSAKLELQQLCKQSCIESSTAAQKTVDSFVDNEQE
jgi:hypothetical protein